MYAACLFCTRKLGCNESIEEFQVGRRLAFDQAKGRLWVLCPHCARWNLSPLEERWEAIEACERAHRDTRLRSSTARARDGDAGRGECRALEGELKALEIAWKEAEQIAAISDDLLLPVSVRTFLSRHRA